MFFLSQREKSFSCWDCVTSSGKHFKPCSEMSLNKALDSAQQSANSSVLYLVLNHFKGCKLNGLHVSLKGRSGASSWR